MQIINIKNPYFGGSINRLFLNLKLINMLNDYANQYIIDCNNQNNGNKNIYNLCSAYLLGNITPIELRILQDFFKIK